MRAKKPTKRVKAGTSKLSADEKREAFVEAFLRNGGNATQASIEAGYSAKSARQAGARMLSNVAVATILRKRSAELVASLELSTERSLRETARIAFSDPRKIMHADGRIKMPHELDEETAAAIASFEVSFDGTIKYKFWPKTTALDQAHKIQGHYEKDNKQKADPLAALLDSLAGNVVGVVKAEKDN